MLSLVSSLVKMRSFDPWKEGAEIAEHENGPGMENGLWCPFLPVNDLEVENHDWIH